MRFETYRKRGRSWEYLGTRDCESSRGAALATSYVHGLRVVGIRPEDSRDKIYVYRFLQPAAVHHGR